jgi:uncharacterized protein (DUF2141 family)
MRLVSGLFVLVLLMWSCAQIVPLTGGAKDTYAPTIDSSKTYPLNGTLNFTGSEVVLKFNEFIKPNKLTDNILITPKLNEKPTYTVKNKTFTLGFNESLAENTTYVINFNGAIQDITEKNDSVFQYVFSTGDFIDSLSISGQVLDSYTNKPVDKCLIAVYPLSDEEDFDSIPYKIQPTYIGQTGKNGKYKIGYLKNSEYCVFAFTDKNKDLKFNPDNEKIGYLSEKGLLVNDSRVNVDFRVFSVEQEETRITKSEFTYPGKFEVVLSKRPELFTLKSNVDIIEMDTKKSDSLVFWVVNPANSQVEFYTQINDEEIDTIRPFMKNKPKKIKNEFLQLSSNVAKSNLLQPGENFILMSKEPIYTVDTAKVIFFDTDSNAVKVDYKITNALGIEFFTLNTPVKYVTIDSGAVTSVYENSNKKQFNFQLENLIAEDYYGTLILSADSISGSWAFELLNDKQEAVQVASYNTEGIKFNNLSPGKYQLRAVKDDNDDGKWTTGSLKENQQPEKVFYYTDEIKVRSKWDLEIEWIITE